MQKVFLKSRSKMRCKRVPTVCAFLRKKATIVTVTMRQSSITTIWKNLVAIPAEDASITLSSQSCLYLILAIREERFKIAIKERQTNYNMIVFLIGVRPRGWSTLRCAWSTDIE